MCTQPSMSFRRLLWPPVAVPLWTVCCLCSGVSYSLVSHPSLGLCHVVPRWVESSWTVDPTLYPAPIWFAGVVIYLHVWDTTQVDSVPDSCQLVASLLLSGWCQSLSICSVAGRCFVGRCVYFVSFTGDIVASSFVSLHIMPTLCVCTPGYTALWKCWLPFFRGRKTLLSQEVCVSSAAKPSGLCFTSGFTHFIFLKQKISLCSPG